MLESKVEKTIRSWCRDNDILFYKFVSPGKSGVPDRIAIGPKGKIAFLELKAPGKHPAPLQMHELHKLNARGVSASWFDDAHPAIEWLARCVL